MNRDPSLHIAKSRLVLILDKILPKNIESKEFANEIFKRAKAHSLHTRTVTITNDRIEKKAKKLLSSSRADADLLAQLIYAKRMLLRHRGVSRIKSGSRDWETLKEVAGQALDFCEEFGLTKSKGFRIYLDMGLSKMKKFMVNKLLGMYEGICERYEAILEIQEDEDSEMTELMYKTYNEFVVSHTGVFANIKEIPEKYVHFVRARKVAEQINLSPDLYVEAQLEGLDFTNNVPHPSQMVGIKAMERVARYCYKHNIKVENYESD